MRWTIEFFDERVEEDHYSTLFCKEGSENIETGS
jgi:hypothetical protein